MTPDIERLRILLTLVQHGLRTQIAEHLAGHPKAQACDSDRTTGGGGSDPTVTAALGRDPARHDLEAHDHAVDNAYRALLTLVGLSEKYLPAHMPRRGDIATATRTCALHDAAGVDKAHPSYVRTDLASYIEPPLKEPTDICLACHNFTRARAAEGKGRIPTTDELVRHSRTGKWSARTNGKRGVFIAQGIADEWAGRPEEAA